MQFGQLRLRVSVRLEYYEYLLAAQRIHSLRSGRRN